MDFNLVIGALTAIGAGALIGVERERHQAHKASVAGLRTFMLFSLLGFVSAVLSQQNPFFSTIAFAALIVAVALGYYFSARASREFGLTSEVTSLLTFLIGFMSFDTELRNFAVMLAIAVTVMLAFKEREHRFAEQLEKRELFDALTFLVIVFIVLPILPNNAVDPFGVFNPYVAWLMVVFVSGIGFLGYALVKFYGADKGIAFAGLLGGMVSSTSVAFSMAERSKADKQVCNACASAVSAAESMTFLRVLFITAVVSPSLVGVLMYPLLAMFVASSVFAYAFLKNNRDHSHRHKLSSPLALEPALKFGAVFVVILFASHLAGIYFGDLGVFAASAISGVVSMNAVLLSIATLAGNSLSISSAAFAVFLATAADTLSKPVIAYWRGSRDLAFKTAIVSVSAAVAGAAVYFLL